MYTPGARRAVLYRMPSGVTPYAEFVDALLDRAGAAKIRARVTRAELGNFGDHRGVGGGVIELRVHYGPGYRVYVGLDGIRLIILLGAGAKRSQESDIRRAVDAWDDYRRRA